MSDTPRRESFPLARKLLRFAFYVRSHWIRMPPFKLARHLWTKWRNHG